MVSSIPRPVSEGIVELLGFQDLSSLLDFSFVGGGCINNGGKVTTSKGNFYVKWNDQKKFPDMFVAESRGLDLLLQQKAIRIPQIAGVGERVPYQFLLLEYIEQRSKSKTYWQDLGVQLATLHNATANHFGLDHNNFIGSLIQFNQQKISWVEFFIEQRLNVQLKRAVDNGYFKSSWTKKFELLFAKLPSLIPAEKPSLVHGDLWSGNLITDEKGAPCLIDPAVYFGHREVDLAMTKLFGGFNNEFYTSYQDVYTLSPGFEDRVDVYNLYPLLVHVNLFGGSYIFSVEGIVRRFI